MHRRLSIRSNESLLYISETEVNNEFKATYHSHPNLEILLFLDGKGKVQTQNRIIDVKKHDVMIINSHSKHCEISSSNLKFLALGIHQLEVYLKETYEKKIIYFSLEEDEYQILYSLYNIIMKEADDTKEFSSEIINCAYESIINVIKRNHALTLKTASLEHGDSLVASVVNILKHYYYQPMTLESLAKRLSVSASLISHTFKKQMGISVMAYKLNCQIEEACNLLKISDMSIIDIAQMTGFNHSAYFTKMFKKIVKVTPKEYRDKMKK